MTLTDPEPSAVDPRVVGRRIAHARQVAGLKQTVFARELGVTVRALQNYESGTRVPWVNLDRIASLTGRTKGWFLRAEGATGLESLGDDLAVIVSRLDAIERRLRAIDSKLSSDIFHALFASSGQADPDGPAPT